MPKTKKDWWRLIYKTLIVILGTFLVAFGSTAFLVPLDINAGGLSGVAVIARFYVNDPQTKVLVYNLVVAISAVVLWLVGLLFIGKEFAIKTLVSTVSLPVANWLFTACPGVSNWISNMGELLRVAAKGPTAGNYLMCGMFGGVFIGVGVAITFVGGGSTGGVDVITFLFEKYLKIRQSIASFIVDGTIITVGIILLVVKDNEILLPCLSGIISAFISAVVIEVIYIGSQTSYQVDIISSKWEEISKYAQEELDRGTTIIPVKGGYSGEDKVILRIVFDKRQYNKIRSFIAKTDPNAFVTYTRTNAVFGEGFKSHVVENAFTKKKKDKKDGE